MTSIGVLSVETSLLTSRRPSIAITSIWLMSKVSAAPFFGIAGQAFPADDVACCQATRILGD
jgi:hypothetical protein